MLTNVVLTQLETRTLVPNFAWSLDAPTTANRGAARNVRWISARVRMLLGVEGEE